MTGFFYLITNNLFYYKKTPEREHLNPRKIFLLKIFLKESSLLISPNDTKTVQIIVFNDTIFIFSKTFFKKM